MDKQAGHEKIQPQPTNKIIAPMGPLSWENDFQGENRSALSSYSAPVWIEWGLGCLSAPVFTNCSFYISLYITISTSPVLYIGKELTRTLKFKSLASRYPEQASNMHSSHCHTHHSLYPIPPTNPAQQGERWAKVKNYIFIEFHHHLAL